MINMSGRTYNDPDAWLQGLQIQYPCDTQYMVYNPLTHKYYLTEQAITGCGIDLVSQDIDIKQFITEVTENVYSVMMTEAPFNFDFNCMLVAQSESRMADRYQTRKYFEQALQYQAKYKDINGDIREWSGINVGVENSQPVYHKNIRREYRHISPATIDILKSLGLLFNGVIQHKHLYNYKELM